MHGCAAVLRLLALELSNIQAFLRLDLHPCSSQALVIKFLSDLAASLLLLDQALDAADGFCHVLHLLGVNNQCMHVSYRELLAECLFCLGDTNEARQLQQAILENRRKMAGDLTDADWRASYVIRLMQLASRQGGAHPDECAMFAQKLQQMVASQTMSATESDSLQLDFCRVKLCWASHLYMSSQLDEAGVLFEQIKEHQQRLQQPHADVTR